MKKNIKKRVIFVILFLIICSIYLYINLRGNYIQIIAIDKKYEDIFKTNIKLKTIIFAISFVSIYLITNISTMMIKRGLKKFFDEDKKKMPKLPNKSVSLAFAVIGSLILLHYSYDKALLCFSNVWFGQGDPILNLDISYYLFIIPFIKLVLISIAVLFAFLTVYVVTYYVIVFNAFFHKGIDFKTLTENTFVKHIVVNMNIIMAIIAILVVISIPNIFNEGFMETQDGTSIYGAGLVEITIKTVGYLIFAIFILICTRSCTKKINRKEYKNGIIKLLLIPAYLIILFLLIISTEFIYLKKNEFDKEKDYIRYNIEATKFAYNIKIDEISIENGGTISAEDVTKNKQVLDNINLLNEEIVLQHLKEYYTNLGYYDFSRAQFNLYNNESVYISPREIVSNNTRTYNNKTYQYTHGYDVIITSASELENTGTLKYKRNGFNKGDEFINIAEPRIYFGLQTDEVIVTNSESKLEYDYPITSTINVYNNYDGKAGIHLNFIDRLILGIKEGNLKLALSSEMDENSNIVINRNIIERAKSILPYIEYDPNPYLIISDTGKLVWVLDGYTLSNKYPYSQKTNIIKNEQYQKINYIRNSVKVFIDAYDGTMNFYITDRTDPIIMAYWSKYPSIFEDLNEDIPEEYKSYIVYPQYLYNIQAKQIERYHDIQAEVLYRADDVWSIAKEKESVSKKNSGTKELKPYYSIIKTVDNAEATLGLIEPYTINGKQNITSYLVGTNNKLTIYRLVSDSSTLGTTQLERLIEEDENIANEIETLNVSGTKIEKGLFVIPINNKLLYVEPIYQVLINENKVPMLKKVVVASGDKLAIGNNLKEAIENLLSQEAVNIEVEDESIEYLLDEIIKANKNLKDSNESNDWEMIGKDIDRLQNLIDKLENTRKTNDEI